MIQPGIGWGRHALRNQPDAQLPTTHRWTNAGPRKLERDPRSGAPPTAGSPAGVDVRDGPRSSPRPTLAARWTRSTPHSRRQGRQQPACRPRIHGALLDIHVEVVRRSPVNQGKGFVPQPKRWIVEQVNGTLRRHRRLARRYDHRPAACHPSATWRLSYSRPRRCCFQGWPGCGVTWRRRASLSLRGSFSGGVALGRVVA